MDSLLSTHEKQLYVSIFVLVAVYAYLAVKKRQGFFDMLNTGIVGGIIGSLFDLAWVICYEVVAILFLLRKDG